MAILNNDALYEMDAELAEVLAKKPPASGKEYKPNIYECQHYAAASDKMKAPINDSVSERDMKIPVRDGAMIKIRIYSPKRPPTDGSPLFVVYHGGGHSIGSLDTEAGLCQTWSDKFAGVAVNVDYRLAPQHPFPTGVNDNFDALKWCSQNLDLLKANPTKGFIVGGVSAGGTDAAVVSHLYRDEKLSPQLTGLYLSNGATCHEDAIPEKYKGELTSREQSKTDPVQTEHIKKIFIDAYRPVPNSVLTSPLLFPSHYGLPPTYFQICGRDSLRDEEMLYERILRDDWAIRTKFDIYPGVGHIFWHYFPQLKATRKHAVDTVNALAWLIDEGKR